MVRQGAVHELHRRRYQSWRAHHDGQWPVSPRVARPVYDRWRDVDGVHVPDLCRVEQVGVDRLHGALRSRLRKHGQVVGRGNNRLYVRFDGEDQAASVRPHLLRVLKRGDGDER